MPADRVYTQAELLDTTSLGEWCRDNVWKPMVNGSGVLQVYNTFASEQVEYPVVPYAETGSRDWAVQTFSQVAGAIVPYLVAGKLTGCGLKAIGGKLGATGLASNFLASESTAMVMGAGIYDFMRKPHEGETRIGNAAAGMAAFGVFEAGNGVLGKFTHGVTSPLAKQAILGVGRLGIGAAGGVASFETSTRISEFLGEKVNRSTDARINAIASSSLINFGLPIVRSGANRAVESLLGETPGVRRQLASGEANPQKLLSGDDLKIQNLTDDSPQAGRSPTLDDATVKPQRMAHELVQLKGDDNTPMQRQTEAKNPVEPAKPAEVLKAPEQFKPVTLKPGDPTQLGATVTADGINFAVHSKGASLVELLLFNNETAPKPDQVLPMNRTGDIWHGFAPGLEAGQLYLFKAHGDYSPAADGRRFNSAKVLIDPYSKALTADTTPVKADHYGYDNTTPSDPGRHLRPSKVENMAEMPKSIALKTGDFDWQGTSHPRTPMTDSIIYEVNLKGFTGGDESLGSLRGTYRGLVEKIPYLKKLGVTAVELLPIMEWDAVEGPMKDPTTGKQLTNEWGYNTVAFQAPEARLAAEARRGQQVHEFKSMVRELHRNNIEVILDIVFNHTREGDHLGPTVSFRGLDNNVYYMLKPGKPELYVDHTGCGNTVNSNHPVVQKFILDTLKYWHQEMKVDGFRFDLASVFNYDVDGTQKARTPIIEAIASDPALAGAKLIAEPWSISNYRMGDFADRRWSEWNDKYRDTARRFIKSDAGQTAALADKIAGTPRSFDRAQDRHSVNFVTAHDGFTLNDLVSYNEKHNLRNGENNRDGSNDNHSWNHGVEGPVEKAGIAVTEQARIEQLRKQQMKNATALLMLSQGTPMMVWGDEVRRTQEGNNNAWVQEQYNQFDWSAVEKHAESLRFTQEMIDLRKRHEIGRLGPESIKWHGTEPGKPDFGDHTRFLAWEYQPQSGKPSLYSAFNAYWEPLQITLPQGSWLRLVDTSLPAGQDIVKPQQATTPGQTYTIQPRSSIILERLTVPEKGTPSS